MFSQLYKKFECKHIKFLMLLNELKNDVLANHQKYEEEFPFSYNDSIDLDDVKKRLSLGTLNDFMSLGDCWRSGEDTNRYSLLINDSMRKNLLLSATNAFCEYMKPNDSLIISGKGWYPPGGYMGWHTNSCTPGIRIYCSFAKEHGKSYFAYYKDGEIIKCWDDCGWNFRMFSISSNLFWHCVYSETDRISLGFRIIEDQKPSKQQSP